MTTILITDAAAELAEVADADWLASATWTRWPTSAARIGSNSLSDENAADLASVVPIVTGDDAELADVRWSEASEERWPPSPVTEEELAVAGAVRTT